MTPFLPVSCVRAFLSLGLVAGLLLAVGGCGGTGPDTTAPTSGGGGGPAPAKTRAGKPQIALIMKSLANEFFSTMAEGARSHQKQHADQYDLIVNGIKDERDQARQQALVDEMIAQGVQAIVIAPADSKSLVSVCKRAKDAGIVVVNIDNKFDADVLKQQGVTIPFVGPDNRAGAKMIGDLVARQLKAGDPVAMLEGIPTAFNGQQRKLGFEDAMKAAGFTISDSQSGQWETALANQVASAMLTRNPGIKALLCCNDNMALGALASVKAAGKDKQVIVVGYDGISAVKNAIRDGSILATADQHADQLAVFGIEYALQMLKDGSTPTDRSTPVELVTKETLK